MTTEELADYIKEKYKLSDEEILKYAEMILGGLESLSFIKNEFLFTRL